MKRLIILSTALLLTHLTFAFGNSMSTVNFRLNDLSEFAIMLDGENLSPIGLNQRIEFLNPGTHQVDIYKPNHNRGRNDLMNIYRGYINVINSSEMFVTINPRVNDLRVDRISTFNNQPTCGTSTGFNPGRNPERTYATVCEPVRVQPRITPMNPSDFEMLKHTIANAGFESTRMSIFRQASSVNYFTTAQVRELMQLFWFDSSKLELAKKAYSKTVDQQNYYVINNEFSFSSSVNQLNDYLTMR